jgi:hypothetical protein
MKETTKKNDAKAKELESELENDILVIQEATHLADGTHKGVIQNVVHEKRTGFDYIDVYIDTESENGEHMTVKTGFPAYISTNSSFGRFLLESGLELTPGEKLSLDDIKEHIVLNKIQFQTYTEDNFAKVVNKTIKFLN